jgi:uncharacterized protein (DUF1810 family)
VAASFSGVDADRKIANIRVDSCTAKSLKYMIILVHRRSHLEPNKLKNVEKSHNLSRFLDAQQSIFDQALSEIRNGRKRGHWIWYIFPQLSGLGISETSTYYGLRGILEARAYLNHPVLGKRLILISNALLDLDSNNASQILGSPDDMKLRSSMTLFSLVSENNHVFQAILTKFFEGNPDPKTLSLLSRSDFPGSI